MAFYPSLSVLWKVVLYQSLFNQEIQNVFHFVNKQDIPTDEALGSQTTGLLDDFNTRIANDIKNLQSGDLKWVRITNTVIIPRNGPFSETVYPPLESGNQEGPALPSYVAAVLSKFTGFSGRTNRGRYYFAGMPEDFYIENDLSDTAYQHLLDIAAHMIVNWSATGADTRNQVVLYSHKDGDIAGIPQFAGVKFIKAFAARRQLYTQRHRLKGVGV